MAEQSQPIRRKVALKIIKAGMDTEQVVARFEAERQALAMMNHPNIAKVLDAGATEQGRPYFVMELVRGIPITEFCNAHKLPLRERLELFSSVCEAVHHAHQKGIIHRDLKPSNLLVELHDVKAVTKVIDFGIAKATNQQLTERTVFTNFAQVIGTPMYMSPEQAQQSGLDIDIRSDIYSLGVLLYELLTGTTPISKESLVKANFDELRRMIIEDEPPRPSARISTLNAEAISTLVTNQRDDGLKLSHGLRGELDWVAIKALEKDRTRRYQSALAFRDDINRFLKGEPLEAHPPSLTYQFKKVARRYRGMLLTASALLIILFSATAISIRFAFIADGQTKIAKRESQVADEQRLEAQSQRHIARVAEQTAKTEAENAKRSALSAKTITRFLTDYVLAKAEPLNSTAESANVFRDALDNASQYADRWFAQDPELKASLYRTIGQIYARLGDYDKGASQFRLAQRIYLESNAPASDLLECMNGLGLAEYELNHLPEAEAILRKSLEQASKSLGDQDPVTLAAMLSLAKVLMKKPPSEPESLVQVADSIPSQSSNPSRQRGEAETLARKVLESRKSTLGIDHPETAIAAIFLAEILISIDFYQEADEVLKPALVTLRNQRGIEDLETQSAIYTQAKIFKHSKELDMAAGLYREILQARMRVQGPRHSLTLAVMADLANSLKSQGHLAEAEAVTAQLLQAYEVNFGRHHPGVRELKLKLADLLWQQGKLTEAEKLLRSNSAIVQVDDPGNADFIALYGDVLIGLGKLPEAEELMRKAWENDQKIHGPNHYKSHNSLPRLLLAIAFQRKRFEYDQLCFQHLDKLLLNESPLDGVPEMLAFSSELPLLDENLLTLLKESLDHKRATLSKSHLSTAMTSAMMGRYLLRHGIPREAEALLLDSLAARKEGLPKDHWLIAETESLLGDCLAQLGRYDEAEKKLVESYHALEKSVEVSPAIKLEFVQRICTFYAQQNEKKKNQLWLVKLESLLRTRLDEHKRSQHANDGPDLATESRLAECLVWLGRHEDADELLLHDYVAQRLKGGWFVAPYSDTQTGKIVEQSRQQLMRLYRSWARKGLLSLWEKLDSLVPGPAYASVECHQHGIRVWEDAYQRNQSPLLRLRLALAHSDLGLSYLRTGEPNEATRCLQTAIELLQSMQLEPNVEWALGNAYSSLGDAYNDAQNFPEAIAAYEKAASIPSQEYFMAGKPSLKGGQISLVLFLVNCKNVAFRDVSRAIKIAQQAEWQEDDRMKVALGLAHYCNGDWQAAIDVTEKLRGAAPGLICAMSLQQLGDDKKARFRYDTARAFEERVTYNQARAAMLAEWPMRRLPRQLISEASKVLGISSTESDAMGAYWRGVAMMEREDFEAAAVSFRTAIRLYPSLADAYWRLTAALGAIKPVNSQEIADAIKKYFELSVKTPTAEEFAVLGCMLGMNGETDESIVVLKKAIDLDPKLGLAYNGLGASLGVKGRFAEAEQACREAMKLMPLDARPLENLAWILATCDDLSFRDTKQAIQLASDACEKQPSESGGWRTLGVALYRNGEYQQATDALKKSIDLAESKDEICLLFLAMAHWQLGQKDDSHSLYKQSRELAGAKNSDPKGLERIRNEAKKLFGMP
ncbi:MAG: tetratricopeptide repeat protein [Pirellula sp.]